MNRGEFINERQRHALHKTKLVVTEGFNHSLGHTKAKSRQVCYFRKDELGKGAVRFSVTPINCFGVRGRTIEASYGQA